MHRGLAQPDETQAERGAARGHRTAAPNEGACFFTKDEVDHTPEADDVQHGTSARSRDLEAREIGGEAHPNRGTPTTTICAAQQLECLALL